MRFWVPSTLVPLLQTADHMRSARLQRRAAHALLRTVNSSVSVNLRTGKLHHTPPPLVYEKSAQQARNPHPGSFSLTDSIMRVEAGLVAGELRATEAIKQGWRRLVELERQEEEDQLDEADRLGLA